MNMAFYHYLTNGIDYKGRLTGESAIAYEFRTWLTKESIDGNLNCIWFHVANEVSNGKQFAFGAKLKAMGKLPGVADYVLISEHKGALLELKYGKGKQKEEQVIFESWCNALNVVYKVARTIDEAIAFVTSNGFIKCKPLDCKPSTHPKISTDSTK